MGSIDIVLLTALVVSVLIASMSRRWWTRGIVALGLIATTLLCCVYVIMVPRIVTQRRTATRGWTEEYRDGVLDMSSAVDPCLPYFVVSVIGMAVLLVARKE